MKVKTGRYSDIVKEQARLKVKPLLSGSSYSGNAPAPFIGRFGYPHVNIGIMAPPQIDEEAWRYDAPRHWSQEQIQIPKIVEYRSSLINSRFQGHVKKPHKYLEIAQEVGMASKPVEIEVN